MGNIILKSFLYTKDEKLLIPFVGIGTGYVWEVYVYERKMGDFTYRSDGSRMPCRLQPFEYSSGSFTGPV